VACDARSRRRGDELAPCTCAVMRGSLPRLLFPPSFSIDRARLSSASPLPPCPASLPYAPHARSVLVNKIEPSSSRLLLILPSSLPAASASCVCSSARLLPSARRLLAQPLLDARVERPRNRQPGRRMESVPAGRS
jgi:hypothetical protein